jgi:hypothetical protein
MKRNRERARALSLTYPLTISLVDAHEKTMCKPIMKIFLCLAFLLTRIGSEMRKMRLRSCNQGFMVIGCLTTSGCLSIIFR